MKLWDKGKKLNEKIEKFTVGKDYLIDQRLVEYDCIASIVHAKMLEKIGIITREELEKLTTSLKEIMSLSESGNFEIKQEDEDCHTAIENYLVKKLGDTGKKIHTARSRNDQVLTALRLYHKDQIGLILKMVDTFILSLEKFKGKYGFIQFPGYTHMRKAMPSSIGLWSQAFIDSMQDNKKLLLNVKSLMDQSPLGTGAGYGVPIVIDRDFTAKELCFSKVQSNPIYVQNSRGKFESSIMHAINQVMLDLNKISSDLILFSMPEFGYFELSSEICTGSSLMPHKKNPDVLELLRAKYHETIAYEFQLKSLIANLISGYNRDLQLTKEPVIKSFDIVKECLNVMMIVIDNTTVNEKNCKKAMTSELYSVDMALEKVKKGVSFREAYNQVSEDLNKE